MSNEKTRSISDETDGLPEEVAIEIKNRNFVRAALVAMQKGVSHSVVHELERNAVRHFIEDLHNFEGAKKLISDYDLSFEEVRMIIRDVLDRTKSRTELWTFIHPGKGKMVAMTLTERILKDPLFRKYL